MPVRDNYWDRGSNLGESTLDPAQYHDPSEEMLPVSKTTTAAVLPPGIWGARGTIIRRSTLGGAPLGFDPNGVGIRVNVDPDIPGQGFVIDPTQISEAMAAVVAVEEGVSQAQTIEDLRFRASSAMQRFAINERIAPVPGSQKPPRVAPLAMPGVYVVPEATEGGTQLPQQQYQPNTHSHQGIQTKHAVNLEQMAKHPNIRGFAPDNSQHVGPQRPAQGPEVSIAPTPRQNDAPPAHPRNVVAQKPASLFANMDKANAAAQRVLAPAVGNRQQADIPTYKVTMEVKGSPISIDAWYHDIVRNEQILTFVYDTRAVGFNRTRLHPQDEEIALHVEGADALYICIDPGISFVYPDGGNEYTVFLIKSEHPFHEEPVAPPPLRMPGPEWDV